MPKRFEDILLTLDNAHKIESILKECLPERYKDIYRHNKGMSDFELCESVMKNKKPEWSIIIGRELPNELISDGVISLLKIIVNRPKTETVL